MFDFPSSPTVGQIVTGSGGVQWQWDGTKWTVINAASPGFAPINSPTFTGDPQAPTAASGDADTSVATTAFVAAAVAPASNNVGRNLLHNPLFNIQQRGTGPWTAAGYTTDRWQVQLDADTVDFAVGAMNDTGRSIIGDEAALYYMANTFTGNAGAAAYSALNQNIEGVRRLSGKTVTVSFWATASAALKFGVAFIQSFGSGGSPSAGVSITGQSVTLSTTWTRYSVTVSLPSASGKTFGTNGGDYTALYLVYSAGSTNNAWAGGVGVQSGTINLWGVQLEIAQPGQTQPTPLEKPDPRYDLANCQRFYQAGLYNIQTPYSQSGNNMKSTFMFPVTMRNTPTMTATVSGSAAVDTAAFGVEVDWRGAAIIITCNATGAAAYWNGFWTASADL